MTDPERPRTTPEGHTPEEPRASELGKAGTPGAGRTSDAPHSADEPAAESHHAADLHMDVHTELSDDDHGHAEARLGPIDWPAWGYALMGVVAGLLIVGLFFVAVGGRAG